MEARKQFEIFDKQDLVYFDNSASTLKPKCVCDAVDYYNRFESVNSGRGVYRLAFEVTSKVERARQKVAAFLGAQEDEIVFLKNTTEGVNLVALTHVAARLKEGDEVVVSQTEHHSNYLPFLALAKQKKAKLVNIPLDENGKIMLENAQKVIGPKTKFVTLHYVSNTLGYKTPVKEVIALAHAVGATVLVDASQAMAHTSVNVQELDCDFLTFSGYKMFGPTGVGVLFAKKQLLEQTEPLFLGGGMVQDIEEQNVTFQPVPYKFEAGTLPIDSIIGLGSAIDFVNEVGFEHIEKVEKELLDYLLEKLSAVEGVEIYSHKPDYPIIIFNIKNVHAHDAASMYDEFNVCLRAGHHCASLVNKWFHVIASLRVSLAFYNTKQDIDRFVFATKQIAHFWNK